jgi:drug/metabolite transporter (DMT)-like permease
LPSVGRPLPIMNLMTRPTLRTTGAAALALVGVIHLVLSPEYLDEQTYIGVLFILGGVVLCALAVWLLMRDAPAAWLLAALVMAGMGIGFVLSRTTGLPGFHESEWELSGVICLVLEGAFVAVTPVALSGGGLRDALTA